MNSKISIVAMALAMAASSWSQTTGDQNTNQVPTKPPPIPTGVVPLPQGPPVTSPQGPTPKAVKPAQDPNHPLAWSPDIAGVESYLANKPVTLDEAVAIALYTNRSFATAVAQLEQAAARTGIARAQLTPTLGVGGNVTEYDAPTTFNLSALAPSGSSSSSQPPFTVVPQFNPIFTASFTLPIDIFGTLQSAVSQAQFNEVAARIEVNRVRNQSVYDVKSAFYSVLRAQAQVAVATDTVNNTLARLSDANKNYAAGTDSRFDVITAQRDVANAQQSLINARGQVTVNLATLKSAMGIKVSSRLSISDAGAVSFPPGIEPPIIPPVRSDGQIENPTGPPAVSGISQTDIGNDQTPKPAPPLNKQQANVEDPGGKIVPLTPPSVDIVNDDFDFGPGFAGLLDEAKKNRPELLEAEAQITAGRKGLQFARRSELPGFSLSLQDVYTPNATGFTRRNEGVATLSFNIPIYDGGLAKATVREQEGAIAQAQVNRRQMEDQVESDVQQAYVALSQARQRVAVSNVELSQARESFRVSRIRYRTGVSAQVGVSPQLELSNAQTSLAQAQSDQVNALYDYNTARAQLDRALGRFAYNGEKPGYESRPSDSKIK